MRALSSLAAATLLLTSLGATAPAFAHGDDDRNVEIRAQLRARGVDTPLLSGNVAHPGRQPRHRRDLRAASRESAPTFVISGLEPLTVCDVSDARPPGLTGMLPNAVFENEAMTCGEKRTVTKSKVRIRRFALIGIDLHNVAVDENGIAHTNDGGGES